MANTITSSTFSNTYRDDYLDSDGFYRVLFNSGVALQARELTQLQTIINKQIERFGNNIFKEGAAVKAGAQSIDNLVEFIKLQDLANFPLPNTISDLIGRTYRGATSLVEFEILDVVAATGSDPAVLYIRYTDTLSSTNTDTTVSPKVIEGETLEDTLGGTGDLKVAAVSGTNLPTGRASKFNVDTSIHYVKGFFVYSAAQSIILSKFNNEPTVDVGFKVVEEVITVADDDGLYDNQGTTPNISAPGADRYRIRLVLTTKDQLAENESFVYICKVERGIITRSIQEGTSYAIPRDLIAQRIRENSGDYLVQPFTVRFENDSSDTHLVLNYSDGVGVVSGYRAAITKPGTIRVPKATATYQETNETVGITLGNYVLVDQTETSGIPNTDTLQVLTIKSGTGWTGTSIGTCRVRAINETNTAGEYEYYIFDINMEAGWDFGQARSIGTSTSDYFQPKQFSNRTVLERSLDNDLLFDLPRNRPQVISGVDVTYQKRITQTGVSGGSEISITGELSGDEVYANTGDWILAYSDSAIEAAVVNPSTLNSTTATLTPPAKVGGGTGTLEVLAYVKNSNATIRQKNLVTRAIDVAGCESDGNGYRYIDLHRADGYDVLEIVKTGDSAVSYANRFVFDNGQRDNYYGTAKLVLQSEFSDPGATYIRYRYFSHTAGDLFAVNSYNNISGFTYGDIPDYTKADGTTINLRNVLDFRPVADSDGQYDDEPTGAQVSLLPQPNTLTTLSTIDYYLNRRDKLVLDKYGSVFHVQGVSGFKSYPTTPTDTLALYEINLSPNTLNSQDLTMNRIENKRFTMKDIARLEDRVDKIEEYTSLSLLELDTLNFDVLDSVGNNRTKAGILADNFTSHLFSDTTTSQHRAAIDPIAGTLRPTYATRNVRLVYDSDNSVNTIRKGDNVYIKYEDELYLDQQVASSDRKLNPFTVTSFYGHLEISPASDTWHDYERIPRKVIDGGLKIDAADALLWNSFEWNWNGKDLEDLTAGDVSNKKTSVSGYTTTKTWNKVTKDYIVEKFLNEKVVFKHHINTMRANKIYFKATGLRPNTRMFAFFNGTNVSDFVKQEDFKNYSEYDSDYSQQYKTITEHPDGKTAILQTDFQGSIEGSFFLPSTDDLSFSTGTAEFKLLDISANNDENALSYASAIYTSEGQLYTRQDVYKSTRVLDIDGKQSSVTNKPPSGSSGDGGPQSTGSAGWHNYNGGFYSDGDGGVGSTSSQDGQGGPASQSSPF